MKNIGKMIFEMLVKFVKVMLWLLIMFVILIIVLLLGFVYTTDYKKTTCDTAVSPDGVYQLTLQAIGEPDWPFGSASGRLILKESDSKITQIDFELRNDGGSISNDCWTVTWYEEYVEVILSGEEQFDEQILLYYDGKKERKQLTNQKNEEAGVQNSTSSSGVEKIIDTDATVIIRDFSISIYESEQEILEKLDMDGLKYEKVDDSDMVAYDYYYDVDDGTDGFVQIYFLNEECVRIRISCNEVCAHTAKGIYPTNTYSQMVEQYGDSYEKHTYTGKEIYTIYRYKLGEYFHEFGIAGEESDTIYNVDIYVASQFPIYDYGEEMKEPKIEQ